jgi:uncharacterized protein (DUF1697 family)
MVQGPPSGGPQAIVMTHVAFLRAVNVGGRGLVKMADLQHAFAAAGAKSVRTVIASGNVLFEAPAVLGPLRRRILNEVRPLLGADPQIAFRTQPYLERLIAAAPFGPLVNDRTLKLYVLFLLGRPKRLPALPMRIAKEVIDVTSLYERDALIVSRRKPNGFYGFPGLWTEEELGVASTARSWSTILRIAGGPT